jgi:hypothetical protein
LIGTSCLTGFSAASTPRATGLIDGPGCKHPTSSADASSRCRIISIVEGPHIRPSQDPMPMRVMRLKSLICSVLSASASFNCLRVTSSQRHMIVSSFASSYKPLRGKLMSSSSFRNRPILLSLFRQGFICSPASVLERYPNELAADIPAIQPRSCPGRKPFLK